MSRIYKSAVIHRTPEWWIYRCILWMFALLGFIDLLTGGSLWRVSCV